MGIRRHGGLEVQRVGEVEVAVDPDPTRDTHLVEGDVEVPGLGGRLPLGFGLASGSNRALASSINRPSWAGPMLWAKGATMASTNAAAFGEQTDRPFGNEPQLPRRQLTATIRAQHPWSR